MVASNKWASVKIPRSLHEKVREFVRETDSGYSSIGSFYAEAIRLRIEDVKKTIALIEVSERGT